MMMKMTMPDTAKSPVALLLPPGASVLLSRQLRLQRFCAPLLLLPVMLQAPIATALRVATAMSRRTMAAQGLLAMPLVAMALPAGPPATLRRQQVTALAEHRQRLSKRLAREQCHAGQRVVLLHPPRQLLAACSAHLLTMVAVICRPYRVKRCLLHRSAGAFLPQLVF